jgi:hypothetical protein
VQVASAFLFFLFLGFFGLIMSNSNCPHLCQFWVIKKSKEFSQSSRRWLQRCKHDWLIAVYFDLAHHQVSKHWFDPLGNLVAKSGNHSNLEEKELGIEKLDEVKEGMTRQSSQESANIPSEPRIFESESPGNV